MKHYTVMAEKSDQWWSLQCLEVPGALSQVADLSDVRQIEEAIAWVAEVPISDIEIELIVSRGELTNC